MIFGLPEITVIAVGTALVVIIALLVAWGIMFREEA